MSDYPIIDGKIAIFSPGGSVAITGWLTDMTPNPQKMSLNKQVEKVVLPDSAGHVISRAFHSPKETLSITLIPFDPSGTTAVALKAVYKLPPPGLRAVISGNSAGFDGNWDTTGDGSIESGINEWSTMTITIDRPAEAATGSDAAALNQA